MHHIQAKILRKLLYVADSNYAGMRPEQVESNHFAYHLEQLVKSRLVVKVGKRYRLSTTGLALIDRLSHEKMSDRVQPHIVTAIDLTTPNGQTLLFKRNFQPYLYLLGFPLGKVHYEEAIATAAARELQEKTGLSDIPLEHRGMVYIEARQEEVTISKVLYHVFHAEVPKPLTTRAPAERGECLWADYRNYTKDQLMPGFLEVKHLLEKSQTLFFAEIVAAVPRSAK